MTTPRDPEPEPDASIPDGSDARDEVVARALAVPPLDELTRARLLRRTLDEVARAEGRLAPDDQQHRRRFLVASAAAAVLVVAIAVGLVGGDSQTTPTASPQPSSEKVPTTAKAPAAAGQSERALTDRSAAPAPTDVRNLGDLGPVDDLDSVVIPPLELLTEAAFVRVECNGRLPRLEAIGTGTRDGITVQVEIRRRSNGSLRLVVVIGCTVVDSRRL